MTILELTGYMIIMGICLALWVRNDQVAKHRYDNVWKDKPGRNFRHSYTKMLLQVWRKPEDFR